LLIEKQRFKYHSFNKKGALNLLWFKAPFLLNFQFLLAIAVSAIPPYSDDVSIGRISAMNAAIIRVRAFGKGTRFMLELVVIRHKFDSPLKKILRLRATILIG
jgi:hypothetical protein